MGCPVNSIKAMEESLLHHGQKLVIVILASANSDSRAVDFILHNFHEMDLISDDVDFYLPGYGINKFNHYGNARRNIDCILREATEMYPDFHIKQRQQHHWLFEPIYDHDDDNNPIVIESPRLGEIVFNMADFTDFVLEFTRRIDGFHYLGGCQMILLQPKEDGTPNYSCASVYDLDSVINSHRGPSLDAFLHRTFQLIRNSEYEENFHRRTSQIQRLLFGRNNRQSSIDNIIKQIDALYFESTRFYEQDEKYEIVIQNIIVDMNNCLRWDVRTEDFYFISYSSRNVMQAETLKHYLQHHNIHVWIAPDGIPQGREYPVVIPTALKLAKVFVLLLTPDSARSQWVRRELAIAINNSANTRVKVLLSGGMTIDSIRADNELEFLLDRVQIKYNYDEVVRSMDSLERFIHE